MGLKEELEEKAVSSAMLYPLGISLDRRLKDPPWAVRGRRRVSSGSITTSMAAPA